MIDLPADESAVAVVAGALFVLFVVWFARWARQQARYLRDADERAVAWDESHPPEEWTRDDEGWP